jgi:hypothetical protein
VPSKVTLQAAGGVVAKVKLTVNVPENIYLFARFFKKKVKEASYKLSSPRINHDIMTAKPAT